MNKYLKEHTAKRIKERLTTDPKQSYLRDWIYGGMDGAVTTFAVVSGAVGGHLSLLVVIILGFANLIADGFSMAAGNFLGTKSEVDQYNHYKKIEEDHVANYPHGEKQEIRQILANNGISKENIEKMTSIITENKSYWIKMMLQEEYGLPKIIRSPIKAALSTFIAFLLCGLAPLLPYIIQLPNRYSISTLLTAAVFFAIGTIKSRWSLQTWWQSGLSTLAIGIIVALLAFFTAYGLRVVINLN